MFSFNFPIKYLLLSREEILRLFKEKIIYVIGMVSDKKTRQHLIIMVTLMF